jgi:hypothetical protein
VEAVAVRLAANKISVGRAGDVIVVTARGVFSARTHVDIRAAIGREIRLGGLARSVVIDERQAIHVMSDEERHRAVLEAAMSPNPVHLPIAVVIPEVMLEAVTAQCACAWQHGRMWVPFLDFEDGLAWARGQAAHWMRQRLGARRAA